MDYLSLMYRRVNGEEDNIPNEIEDKVLVRKFADFIGVITPEIIQVDTLSNIDIHKLPKSFVLKPTFASTSIGVKLLEKEGNGKLKNLITNETVTWESITNECILVSNRFFPDNPNDALYLVEELIYDHDHNTPPQDIRFYCFQGEVGLILKENHLIGTKSQVMYFDGNFLPFPDPKLLYGVAPNASNLEEIIESEVPKNWLKLLNVAKRISVAVPTPFARIDLYDTPKGVYLGEITLTPGTFYYKNRKIISTSENYRLGRMWLDSRQRMAGTKNF